MQVAERRRDRQPELVVAQRQRLQHPEVADGGDDVVVEAVVAEV